MHFGLILFGTLAGGASAVSALVSGSGLLHALMLYGAVGASALVTVAIAVAFSACLQSALLPRVSAAGGLRN